MREVNADDYLQSVLAIIMMPHGADRRGRKRLRFRHPHGFEIRSQFRLASQCRRWLGHRASSPRPAQESRKTIPRPLAPWSLGSDRTRPTLGLLPTPQPKTHSRTYRTLDTSVPGTLKGAATASSTRRYRDGPRRPEPCLETLPCIGRWCSGP